MKSTMKGNTQKISMKSSPVKPQRVRVRLGHEAVVVEMFFTPKEGLARDAADRQNAGADGQLRLRRADRRGRTGPLACCARAL